MDDFAVGDLVTHPIFGEGTVIALCGRWAWLDVGDDEAGPHSVLLRRLEKSIK